ncbi:hypothetical protein F4680DRAFT_410743 [Xylaria scruposa]|nr:hypothetical protein F4680DRAFT_410743 [Xylaria scruposa]
MHWIYRAEIILIFILMCWYFTVSTVLTTAIALCKAVFKYSKIVAQAIIKHAPSLIRLYNENLQGIKGSKGRKRRQDCATQTPDCDSCARLRHELAVLQERQQSADFDASIKNVMHEQKVELEANLNEANAELRRSEQRVRDGEKRENHQRAKIQSLNEALRLARDDNNSNTDERFKESVETQKRIIKMLQRNEQLKVSYRQQTESTLRHKNLALEAQRELNIWGSKIKTLVYDRNELRQELDRARAELRRQERRASGQREGRIRAEIENEGLRRPRTTVWREREVMFT